MHPNITIALRAAREAAAVLVRFNARPDRIRNLDQQGDRVVTNAHREAEQAILYQLQKVFPEHSYYSTVSDPITGNDDAHAWLIAPLDGITNLQRGSADWAITVAIKRGSQVQQAVVLAPATNEEYTASRGSGATLNNHRIRVSNRTSLENSHLAIDSRCLQDDPAAFQLLTDAIRSHQGEIRISGCNTLDLVNVATGKLDAGFMCGCDPEVLSAGQLLLQEAGGLLSTASGDPQPAAESSLVFGNPRCLKQLVKILRNSAVTK